MYKYLQIGTFFMLLLFQTTLAQNNTEFTDILVAENLGRVVGLAFDDNGRMYTWAKSGKVFILEDGEKLPDPLIDISEEVTNYNDYGLLGFALHPDFLTNGYFYLLYAVDRHHLLNYGTPEYSSDSTITHQATIGRVTRYTADINDDFKSIVPGSRKVLIGESKTTGIPLLHSSHGIGTLAFGSDKTLLISVGDGASFTGTDIGGMSSDSYNFQGFTDGIIREKEDVGAFRSQLVDCHNGKILRIDPETGDGLSSNPFYDSSSPRAPKSRVWALGLRNPYRIQVQPETGSSNPEDGDPGIIYVGDVGWAYWEEINIIDRPGMNFGWPMYEGVKSRYQYFYKEVENKDAPNPLYDPSQGCEAPYFSFKDLLLPATTNSDPIFPNPCFSGNIVPEGINTFLHQRPMITWSNFSWNTEEQGTYIPGFDSEGNGIFYDISAEDSPVRTDTFTGFCTIGGVFYTGTQLPSEFQNRFIGGDMSGWIRSFEVDHDQNFAGVEKLFEEKSRMIHLTMNPDDECIYYIKYDPHREIRKICFGGNYPPVAEVDYSSQYGPSPMTVLFDASDSFDPEGGPIDFHWDFGDGETSTLANPSHEFVAPDENPLTFLVKLTVTDSAGDTDKVEIPISLNNTPPTVQITSVKNGDRYSVSGPSFMPLKAEVSDIESSEESINYKWEVFFHHNTHYHPEPADENKESEFLISPEGCNGETFWYRIRLTATDPHGLEGVEEIEIYPYCGDPYVTIEDFIVEANDKTNELFWGIDASKSGLSFDIQRSDDLTRFYTIGTVSVGTGQVDFQFEDINPIDGLNFYRIKVSGPDKWYDFSPHVQVKFPAPNPIEIFPNPFKNKLSIFFQEIEEVAKLEIFDLQGKILLTREFGGSTYSVTHQVIIDDWNSGVYIFKVESGEDRLIGKLIKE